MTKQAAKPRTTKRTTVRAPSAVRVDTDAEQIYVRLPLPASVVVAIREHVDNALRLREILAGREQATAGDLLDLCKRAADAVDRDVKRIKR